MANPNPTLDPNSIRDKALTRFHDESGTLDSVRKETFQSLSDLAKCIPLGLRSYVIGIIEGMIRQKGAMKLRYLQEFRQGIIEPLLNQAQQNELQASLARLSTDQLIRALAAKSKGEVMDVIELSVIL